jgi:general L-amino acid transport system permease protein
VQPGNFPNYGTTGLTMSKLFFPVFVGVTIYTAAFIAEVVRGGILAISKGQTEAGLALGLHRTQLLRFIILPQAFRIILPPMGNQYLNVAKNTSLGIAVAYPEVVAVGQTLYNQTGATIPVVLLWMLFYVSVSLTISAIVNWYNRRMQIVER